VTFVNIEASVVLQIESRQTFALVRSRRVDTVPVDARTSYTFIDIQADVSESFESGLTATPVASVSVDALTAEAGIVHLALVDVVTCVILRSVTIGTFAFVRTDDVDAGCLVAARRCQAFVVIYANVSLQGES